MSEITTATVKSYSLALRFNDSDISKGEFISFLDPLTSINIALTTDGNGTWGATISCPHPSTHQYSEKPVKPGDTLEVGVINTVFYTVAFSNEPGEQIFQAIRATILGIEHE